MRKYDPRDSNRRMQVYIAYMSLGAVAALFVIILLLIVRFIVSLLMVISMGGGL